MIPSNFTQYDAQRRQLREASPEEIDSALELLLKNDAKLKESIAKEEKYFSGLKQEAKSAKVVVYNDIPLSREAFFEFIERAAPIVCQQKRDERKQELLPQVLVSLARKKAQENLHDALSYIPAFPGNKVTARMKLAARGFVLSPACCAH